MKRYFTLLWLALLSLSITACAPISPNQAYVEGVSSQDAALISQVMTTYVASQLPAASTTLVVASTAQGNDNNPLTSTLIQSLRNKGFAVASTNESQALFHQLSYWVTPLDNGILLRLRLDNNLISWWFPKDADGALDTLNAHPTIGKGVS
jgi:hypothetical protein